MQGRQDTWRSRDAPTSPAVIATRDTSAGSGDMPTGIAVAVGSVTVVVVAIVAAVLPASAAVARLSVMAVALAAFAAAAVDPSAVAAMNWV